MSEEQGFRIVDKRRFAGGDADKPEETPSAEPVRAASPDAAGDGDESRGMPALDFSSLIIIYASQAMTLLGEIPEPQSGQFMTPDLAAARQTIDIVALLQEKTAGNLSAEEAKLVQDVLTKLRLAFVEKARK